MIQHWAKITCILIFSTILLTGCGKTNDTPENLAFTKIDSLTESYLSYNDSILQSWNIMMNDDNQKIKSMRHLVDILQESNEFNHEELAVLKERINHLFENRYTPESLSEERIEEYDFASNALITEITTLAQGYSKYDQNEKPQKIVAEIIAADQRVEKYRNEYDQIVERYNQFLVINQPTIEDAENLDWEKKPKFGN